MKYSSTLDLYNQFIIDTPRVKIILDSKEYEGDSASLFMTLWDLLKTNGSTLKNNKQSKIKAFLEALKGSTGFNSKDIEYSNDRVAKTLSYCTQTVLAEYVTEGYDKWCVDQNHHFVDGGRQIVEISTGKAATVEIKKPFKLIRMEEDSVTFCIEQVFLLTLCYQVETDCTRSSWSTFDEIDGEWELV